MADGLVVVPMVREVRRVCGTEREGEQLERPGGAMLLLDVPRIAERKVASL